MLNESGENEHTVLYSLGEGDAFSFSTVENDVFYVDLSYGLYCTEECFTLCPLSEIFYHKWMLNYVKNIFASTEIMCGFILQFVNVVYHID